MSASRPVKIGITIALAGTLVAGTAGAVRAATVTTGSVSACASSKGKLQLLSKKNTCGKGYHRVTIGKQGPRGVAGPRGLRGVPGVQGVRGLPGAAPISLSITSSGPTVNKQAGVIGKTDLAASVVCSPSYSALYLEDQTGTSDFTVGGSSAYGQGSGGHAEYAVNTPSGNTNPVIAEGVSPTNFTVTKNKFSNFEIVNEGGSLSSNILVGRDGHTFSVMFSSQADPSSCGAQVQIVG